MSKNPRLRGAALMGLVAGAAWWLGPESAGQRPSPHTKPAARAAASRRLDAAPPSAPAPTPATLSAPAAMFGSVWRADQVMVRVTPDADLHALASELGLSVLRAPGRSGMASLGLPIGADPVATLSRLRADDRVASASPMGRVIGASAPEAAYFGHQWHHRMVGAESDPDKLRDSHNADVIVAVLDTGVAYQSRSHAGRVHVAAPSLSGSRIVAPYDFINDDPLPLDDNQHGTHIASLIASDGDVMGGAPGASLMPIKVLDENNEGNELALIEGLWHAHDNGAHIVNLSLSFPSGYRPSAALLEVLEALYESDQLVVAAAGNEGAANRTWPAASPLVVSVSSSGVSLDAGDDSARTDYSNFDGGVTLLAPGGRLDVDLTGHGGQPDGYPDGVLAETFRAGQPEAMGLWFMAGTSQAAAVVSGMAAAMLADGAHPTELRARLADGNEDARDYRPTLMTGIDSGPWPSIETQKRKKRAAPVATSWAYVAINPVLVSASGTARPRVWVVVRDEALEPLVGATVRVQAWVDGDTEYLSCTTNLRGACQATTTGLRRPPTSQSVWQVSVHGVIPPGGGYMPARSALGMNDDLDAVVGAFDAAVASERFALGSYWPTGFVPGIGPLSAGFAVVNSGSGVSTSPFGVLATEAWMHAQIGGAPPVVGASGDGQALLLATLQGSGIATSPFGFAPVFPPVVTGSGIATSPFGFIPFGGPADPSLPENANGPLAGNLSGSSVGPHIEAGGFINDDGVGGADVVSTAELELQLTELGWAQAASIESVELRP